MVGSMTRTKNKPTQYYAAYKEQKMKVPSTIERVSTKAELKL
ncbi:hypothetical protein P5673_023866 [Acropora cervicornis]|uniref:Uncharacterized protein n=1 Tax=Acropora cervicornis TaxID=6130 RepID=A0AAD9Q4J1_ACRCE|nr:hypothetical protein P5673_023866 [Acropora cervicornis]